MNPGSRRWHGLPAGGPGMCGVCSRRPQGNPGSALSQEDLNGEKFPCLLKPRGCVPYPPPLASGPASSFTASLKLLPLLHARHRLLLAELSLRPPLRLLEITSAPSWTSQIVPALQDPELDCVCTAAFVTSGNIPKLQGLDMERLGAEH